MPNLGFSELVVILMILVLVFGASRLPALGESIGKTIRNVKRGISENDEIEVTEGKKKISDQGGQKVDPNVRDAELVQETPRDPKA